MDEAQLKKILLERHMPPADDNAKKRALNLALAEFDNAQKDKEKKYQGLPLIGRLIGSSNKDNRRRPMKMSKPFMYGGTATALALILALNIATNDQMLFRTTGTAEKTDAATAALLQTAIFSARDSNTAAAPIADASNAGTPAPGKEYRRQDSSYAHLNKSKGEAVADTRVAEMDVLAPQRQAEGKMMAMEMAAPGVAGAAVSNMAAPSSIAVMPPADQQPQYYHDVGRDKFEDFEENPVKSVAAEPVSTFSIDVDTASYSFMRRQINNGVLPQKDAVRIEELVNYFDYNYPLPETREQPFQPTVTVVPSPWKDGNKLIHIGIKGYDIDADTQPRSNLVFLLDTSGSMNSPDKLPLVINSLKLLLDTLKPDDTVGIVVYAGSAGTVLAPTKISDKAAILSALDRLNAGGSTAGAEGIRQAYQLAESNFDKDAVNRVILATDGDFNVGITNPEELKDFVERKRDTGVFLSVLGFGQGNLNDSLMQTLAQNGNGVAAYIDTLGEARKVLVQEATSTLFPIAKDVKIQVEFNPATVAEYRLVGYETRHLDQEDFNNDAVDAGDIGAGHAVTAIYEITPVGGPVAMDARRYAAADAAEEISGGGTARCLGHPGARCGSDAETTEKTVAQTDFSNEYAFLKIRYKLPDEDTSHLITTPVTTAQTHPAPEILQDTNFAIAVASFGELLKDGKYAGRLSFDDVINMAQEAKGADEFGYRAEFINLVRLAKSAADLQKQ